MNGWNIRLSPRRLRLVVLVHLRLSWLLFILKSIYFSHFGWVYKMIVFSVAKDPLVFILELSEGKHLFFFSSPLRCKAKLVFCTLQILFYQFTCLFIQRTGWARDLTRPSNSQTTRSTSRAATIPDCNGVIDQWWSWWRNNTAIIRCVYSLRLCIIKVQDLWH